MKAEINFRKILLFLMLAALAFVACLGSPLNPFSNDLLGTDSSVFITIAQGMLNGKIPYIDFFDHKGPLLYIINCLGLILGSTMGIWVLELLLMNVSIIFCYKTARIFTTPALSLVTTVIAFAMIFLYLDYGNLTEEYSLCLMMPSLYIFTKACFHQSALKRLQVFLLGIFLGLTFMLRPNMFGIWFGFCVVIFIDTLRKKENRTVLRYIVYFFAGTVLSMLPFLIYLDVNHAVHDFIMQYLTFNFQYAAYTTDTLKVASFFQNIYTIYSYPAMWFLFCIFLFSAFVIKKKGHESYPYHIAYTLAIATSIALIGLASVSYLHYELTLVPLFIPATAVSGDYIYKKVLSNIKSPMRMILICLIYMTVFINPFLMGCSRTVKIITTDQKAKLTPALELVEKYTDKDDKISVVGNNCNIYYYSGRESASKYIYQRPVALVSVEIANDYISDIKTFKPKLILIEADIYEQEDEKDEFYVDVIRVLGEESYKALGELADGFYFFITEG